MRRFIYLDTETLNSYIAQIYDGLIKNKEESKQDLEEENKQHSNSVNPTASADLKILGKGIDAKVEYLFNSLKSNKESTLINQVETKILHDNAFDLLIKHIKEKNYSQRNEIGNFIEIFNSFYIIDFLYYKNLFNDKDFINFMIDSTMQEVIQKSEEEKAKIPSKTPNKKQLIKEIDKKIVQIKNQQISEYNELRKIIDIVIKIIPYQRVLCIDDSIVVLSDEYIRDDVQMSSFKYGGKIKVFGYITNIIDSENTSELPVFAEVINSINAFILPEIMNKTKIKIIHPIAIYCE